MAKIAYVGLAGTPSGGTRILAEHLNWLTRLGHSCTLFYILGGQKIHWMETLFEERHLDDRPVLEYFDAVVATEVNTWQVVADDNKFPNSNGKFVFIQMAEHLFFPVGSDEYKKFQGYYEYLRTLRPIVISDWLFDLASGWSMYKPKFVKNGVNMDMFYPEPFKDKPKKPVILIEGHSKNSAKDVLYMSLRAAKWLRSVKGYDFELWGFSQYPQPHEFDRYWRLPDQDTIRKIYSTSDIILKASRYEGRSCVDVEAMACGCAVNRAIITGDDDLVDGHNCLKTEYGKQKTFCDNLMRLIEEGSDLRELLITNGLAYVKDNLDWADIAPVLENALLGE